MASFGLSFAKPIYGSNEPSFTGFFAPGIMITIAFFISVGLTAMVFVNEKKEGTLERSWATGVTVTEVMLTHIISQSLIMVIQVRLFSRNTKRFE